MSELAPDFSKGLVPKNFTTLPNWTSINVRLYE